LVGADGEVDETLANRRRCFTTVTEAKTAAAISSSESSFARRLKKARN
jgi:hypothetical protein